MHKTFGILVIVGGLAGTLFGSYRAYHDSFMASETTRPEAPVGLLVVALSIVLMWLGARIGSPWLERLRQSDWEQQMAGAPQSMLAAARSQTDESESAEPQIGASPAADAELDSPEPVGAGRDQS